MSNVNCQDARKGSATVSTNPKCLDDEIRTPQKGPQYKYGTEEQRDCRKKYVKRVWRKLKEVRHAYKET